MTYKPFSVLMSIYEKENAQHARACFESLLAQTIPASEWVIVEDGSLTDDLYQLLDEYEKSYPKLIKRVLLEKNVGLGLALQAGIAHCTNKIVARMDTDDVCVTNRFEQQLKYFGLDGQSGEMIDIVGGDIAEFNDSTDEIVAYRRVPQKDNDIKQYIKKRCPFNHMTVMFNKEAVERAGGYISWYYNEDYYLWIRMLQQKCSMANTGTVLVNARVGKDTYRRRGGLKYFKSEANLQKYMLDSKVINFSTYFVNVVKRFIVQLLIPGRLRGWVFKKFARG